MSTIRKRLITNSIQVGGSLVCLIWLLSFSLGCAGGDGGSGSGDSEGRVEEADRVSAHDDLLYADYPGNCLSCHAAKAQEMLQTTHYQWVGQAPDMVNGASILQGKLTNAVNSYCINIEGNWQMCGTCHIGRGQRPDDAGSDLENIDCLMCHNSDYAVQRIRLDSGTMGIADPDDSLVRNIHAPNRANCLACHAKAGGGDGVKRGDLSLATIDNADRHFDVHMNIDRSDLNCQACHVFEDHKVIGKGSDLRPTDDPDRGSEVSCLTCHSDKNSPNGHDTDKINDHVARVACQSCHIPEFAKTATETYRDWRAHHDGSPADGSATPGHPYSEKIANLIPVYAFWNRTSDNALLGDDASRTYDARTDTWPTSRPVGDVTAGKLYPFKYKTAMQPKTRADHRLIPLDTYEYLSVTGNVATAIEKGLTTIGYQADTVYDWVITDTYQLLNHGIEPASNALSCNDCHGGSRMDLQVDFGYQLKADPATLCVQCHGREDDDSFGEIHDEHVNDRNYDCSRCHLFSRPERRLR